MNNNSDAWEGGANKCSQCGGATIDPVLSWIFQVYNSRAFQKTPGNLFTLNDSNSLNLAAWLTDYLFIFLFVWQTNKKL